MRKIARRVCISLLLIVKLRRAPLLSGALSAHGTLRES